MAAAAQGLRTAVAPVVTAVRGFYGAIVDDPLRGLAQLTDDVTAWRFLGRRYAVVRSPELVEQVLVAGSDRYVKAVHYRLLAAVTGNGLLTNEGESWAHQRRTIQPLLGRRHLHALAPHMVEATADHLRSWEALDDGAVIDVAEAMTHLTLDVVGRALFGTGLRDAADRLRPAVDVGLRGAVVAARLQQLLALPRWAVDAFAGAIRRAPLLPPGLHALQATMRTVDDVVREIVDRRAAESGDGEAADMVGLLLAARDEHGRPMSRRQVRDELVTFMLAGHETTANGLAWMWYLLARHDEARRRLVDEVDRVVGDGPVTAEAAEALAWTTACFQEAMRLYPPAWILEREAVVRHELGGHTVHPGTTVLIPVYSLHRDPRFWVDPERFDPERFLGGGGPPRGAYLPFGAGRRMCIGAGFALLEAAIVTASIARRYELELSGPTPVEPEATVTLRPRRGLPMRLRRR